MYYKDRPYGYTSLPQGVNQQQSRTPLLPEGYQNTNNKNGLMYSTIGETVKGFFNSPWVLIIIIILIVLFIVWYNKRKDNYEYYY